MAEMVTVTWTEEDVAAHGLDGAIRFTLVEALDSTSGTTYEPVALSYPITAGAGQSDPMLANDDPSVPAGSWYRIDILINGQAPRTIYRYVNFALGTPQALADLPVAVPMALAPAALTVPSGTPAAGDVPTVIADGSPATSWQPGGGGVATVTAADTSVVIGGTSTNPTVRTATLDVIAADHPPAASWSNNGKKITSVANGTAAQDAAAFGQLPSSGTPLPTTQGGTGTSAANAAALLAALGAVSSVAAGDTSIVVGGTATAPTIETGTLDVIASDHPAAANWSNNGKKITSVANGTAAQDAAAFGQLPSSGTPLPLTQGGSGQSVTTAALLLTALGALAAAGGTMTGALVPAVFALTQSGGAVAVDASKGNVFDLSLTASGWTISNPTNDGNGQPIRFRLAQDATGGRTVSWGTAYDFGTAGAPTLSTGASKVDEVGFSWNANLSKWCYLGSMGGF